jgi:drug/metabolite transporter (DMT)-like permease
MSPFGILAGVLGAFSFGLGDFGGAFAARRAGALVVVAGAHLTGLLALLIGLVILRPPLPGPSGAAIGLVAGVAGVAGLAALYRAMSIGSMGLITSLAGSGSLALPLVAGALLGAPITPIQLIGVGCAAAAAIAASGMSRSELGRQSLLLAGAAAISFGAWYVLLDLAARAGDPVWGLVFSRAGSSAIAMAVVAVRGFDRATLPVAIVVGAGLFDVGGNVFYVVAREHMHLGLAAALVGLYPIVTMLLARFVVGERLPAAGQLGVGLALAGIVLISLGS